MVPIEPRPSRILLGFHNLRLARNPIGNHENDYVMTTFIVEGSIAGRPKPWACEFKLGTSLFFRFSYNGFLPRLKQFEMTTGKRPLAGRMSTLPQMQEDRPPFPNGNSHPHPRNTVFCN